MGLLLGFARAELLHLMMKQENAASHAVWIYFKKCNLVEALEAIRVCVPQSRRPTNDVLLPLYLDVEQLRLCKGAAQRS